jgi:hypothetical protein
MTYYQYANPGLWRYFIGPDGLKPEEVHPWWKSQEQHTLTYWFLFMRGGGKAHVNHHDGTDWYNPDHKAWMVPSNWDVCRKAW